MQIEHEGAKREVLGCHETIFAGFRKNLELFAARLRTSAVRLFNLAAVAHYHMEVENDDAEAGSRVGQSIACRRQGRRCEGRPRVSRRASRSDYLPGISAESVGAKALWLGIATIPPGKRTKAHVHEHHETAFYMMSGDELGMWTGDQLQHRDVVRSGDYLYIPANVLHVAVNRGSLRRIAGWNEVPDGGFIRPKDY